MTEPVQLPLGSLGAWAKGSAELDQQKREERLRVLADLEANRLVTVEQRVVRLLRDCLETRESDVALAIEYWRASQADVLAKWRTLELEVLYDLHHFDTLSRARRHIQNDLELFQATLRTQRMRGEAQREMLEYIISRKQGDPEIRFYLDETGTDPSDTFTGVGGICAFDSRLTELQHAALTRWRAERGWPETLHCADMKSDDIDRHLALLAELQKRRAGFLFVGYATRTRLPKRDVLHGLIVHLIRDSVVYLDRQNCLKEPRALVIVKEAEQGFDQFWLESFKRSLQEEVAAAVGERVYVRDVIPLPKGREVLLECADHIAWGMRRRAASGGRNPKDLLAEAVMNMTGFEDPRETGAIYRMHFT